MYGSHKSYKEGRARKKMSQCKNIFRIRMSEKRARKERREMWWCGLGVGIYVTLLQHYTFCCVQGCVAEKRPINDGTITILMMRTKRAAHRIETEKINLTCLVIPVSFSTCLEAHGPWLPEYNEKSIWTETKEEKDQQLRDFVALLVKSKVSQVCYIRCWHYPIKCRQPHPWLCRQTIRIHTTKKRKGK